MIKHVARKEVREIVRDGRMRLLGVIVIILALAALAFGAQQAIRAQEPATRPWSGRKAVGRPRKAESSLGCPLWNPCLCPHKRGDSHRSRGLSLFGAFR